MMQASFAAEVTVGYFFFPLDFFLVGKMFA
jgi:hypothetical protein